MEIDIYSEVKRAIKDALAEWFKENKTESNTPMTLERSENGDTLLTVKQFAQKHHFISEGGLRFKIFCREHNKFDKCCSQLGRKILIKEKEALEWFSNPPPEAGWTYDEKKYPRKR